MTTSSTDPILVTGAAGFIGGEIARRLAEEGRSVAAMDLPGRRGPHLAHPRITVLEGDVTSRPDCDRILHSIRPGHVVHCAAVMGAAPREEFMRVNTEGTRTLASAAAAAGARRFLYIGSVTVHGLPRRLGVDEDSPLRSIGLAYADSKIAAEETLLDLHERGEIQATILRPGDVYGPRSGEWVVKLVEVLRARRMVLIGGGRGLVNITYVGNLADAVEACLARDAFSGRAYLITDGEPVTWRTYLHALAAACGAAPPRLSVPVAAAWPLVLAMEAVFPLLGRKPPLGRMGLRLLTACCSYDIGRAKRELGWEPAVGFEEGMRRTAAWISEAMPARP